VTQSAMTTSDTLTFYHCPNTRSSAVGLLLEELGAPYELHAMSMKKGEQREAAYLKVNPLGKVPALMHRGHVVTESVACFLYLADEFPKAGLAPAIGDPLRGPYLRWMTIYGSAFEPSVVDKALGTVIPPERTGMSTYGSFDALLKTIDTQLAKGPWLLGEKFTAADVLWGTGLTWTTGFKLVPETPVIKAYLARCAARPSLAKHQAAEAALAKKLDG
jgi:glutathione S-transferase